MHRCQPSWWRFRRIAAGRWKWVKLQYCFYLNGFQYNCLFGLFAILGKPQFTKTPANTTASLGDVVILECQAEGHPTPIIAWYHSNTTVKMSSTHSIVRNGSLRQVDEAEWPQRHWIYWKMIIQEFYSLLRSTQQLSVISKLKQSV